MEDALQWFRMILHIQARPPSKRFKNLIQSYVYNIFGEQDELLASKIKIPSIIAIVELEMATNIEFEQACQKAD